MVAASETVVSDSPSFNGMTSELSGGTSNDVTTQALPLQRADPCFLMERGKVTKDVVPCYPRREVLEDLHPTPNTFMLVRQAFEHDVTLDRTVMDMVSHEPEFLPIAIGAVEEIVPDIRDWDEGAEFRLCAFTDPDASGERELQFVVQYSDDITDDEMNRMWDEVARRMDGIAPSRVLRLRTGVSFQPFW